MQAFDNCQNKQGTDTSTQKFYDTLKDYLPTLDSTLKFTHFNVGETPLHLLYQVLSPEVLLKHTKIIDANTLNQKFYNELLYILGLQEIKENSKILIVSNNVPNTLYDTIAKSFQNASEFETIFSLIITWNNRLLFLRLLESMLLSFKHIERRFFDIEIIKDFGVLHTLFFGVLAKKENERDTDIPPILAQIPYLNSSLFDKIEFEIKGKKIKTLYSKPLAIYKDSILKKRGELPLLEYLFEFLHAYDFTTTPKDIKDGIKINHDKLINQCRRFGACL